MCTPTHTFGLQLRHRVSVSLLSGIDKATSYTVTQLLKATIILFATTCARGSFTSPEAQNYSELTRYLIGREGRDGFCPTNRSFHNVNTYFEEESNVCTEKMVIRG